MAGEMSIIAPSFGSRYDERRISVSASSLNWASCGRFETGRAVPDRGKRPFGLRSAAVMANGVTAPQNGVRWRWVDSKIGVPNWSIAVAFEMERLPAIGVVHYGTGILERKRQIDGDELAGGCGVAIDFVGAVAEAVLDHALSDPIAQGRRRVADGRGEVGVEAKSRHLISDVDNCGGPTRADARGAGNEAVQDEIVGRVTDCFVASGFDVDRGKPFMMDILKSGRVVGGPSVVHRGREMKQIAGVNRGAGGVKANCMKELFVPNASDGGVGQRGIVRGECARQECDGTELLPTEREHCISGNQACNTKLYGTSREESATATATICPTGALCY